MAFDDRSLDSYIDVAQRVADFRELYPEGSLQALEPWRVVQVQCEWCVNCIGRRTVKAGGNWKQCPRCAGTGLRTEGEPVLDTFIVYVAAAYRTADDQRPGIGVAWEPYPGRTPYTAGSELMNAETSAWGRAVLAALASDSKKGVASRDEVRNRRAEREDGLPVNADGSLSRSQTSDEEKAAAGVMTSEQHAAHTQLAKGAATGKVPGTRRSRVTPPDDPFYNIPGAGDGDLTPPEDRHGTATAEQIRDINIRLTARGLTLRDDRHRELSAQLGIEVKSSKDLSFSQAAQVLRSLPREPAEATA